ncbi:MAG: hypothetical protein AAGA85_12465 [Bacteroidota bacterium]
MERYRGMTSEISNLSLFCKKGTMMNAAVKYRIISEIINSEDDELLLKIKSLLKIEDEADWWDAIDEDEKAEIEEGLSNADKGLVKPHAEVMAKYKKWL